MRLARCGLSPRWFAEWRHRDALVTHLEDLQLLRAARRVKDHTVAWLNGGLSWQLQPSNGSLGSPHVDHHALVFTADGTRLYDSNDGGIWSTDNPSTGSIPWKNLNGTLALTQYYPSLSIHPGNLGISLATLHRLGQGAQNTRFTRRIIRTASGAGVSPGP